MVGGRVSFHCFSDCRIFLVRGAFAIEGQGRCTETACSYHIKDEEWIGFCGSESIFIVTEEGEQRGICIRKTKEMQEQRAKEKP